MQAKSILQAEEGYQKWINSIPDILNYISKPMENYKPRYSTRLVRKYGIRFIKNIIKKIIFYNYIKTKLAARSK